MDRKPSYKTQLEIIDVLIRENDLLGRDMPECAAFFKAQRETLRAERATVADRIGRKK